LRYNLCNTRKLGWQNFLPQEGKSCYEGRKLFRERFQLMNTEEPNPFVVDDADVDSANPKILTVEEDNDDDEDDDVEIDI